MWADLCVCLNAGPLQNEHLKTATGREKWKLVVFDSVNIFHLRHLLGIKEPTPRCHSQSFSPQLTITSKVPCILNLGIRWRVGRFMVRPLYPRRFSILIGQQVDRVLQPIFMPYRKKKQQRLVFMRTEYKSSIRQPTT